jgi:hypothetical protein
MKTYDVFLSVENIERYRVEAENKDDAYEKVMSGEIEVAGVIAIDSQFTGVEEVSDEDPTPGTPCRIEN